MESIVCNGAVVFYRALAPKQPVTGGPTIVCLHNGGTDHTIWLPVATLLAEQYPVMLLDWPGYGANRSRPTGHGLEDYASVLSSFIAQKQLSSVVLVGNCLGSGAALAHALWAYETGTQSHIQALVLFNVLVPRTLGYVEKGFYYWSGSRLSHLFHTVRKRLVMPRWLTGMVLRYQVKDIGPISAQTKQHLRSLNAEPENVQNLGLLVEALHQSTSLNSLTLPADFPPTMIIWGESNRILPAKQGKRFADDLGVSAFHLMSGGHLVMLEQPNNTAERIVAFIRQQAK